MARAVQERLLRIGRRKIPDLGVEVVQRDRLLAFRSDPSKYTIDLPVSTYALVVDG
jgi:hypothetical protein